ncbi:MAG: hypothetical protein ACRDRG_16640 [Pseudonocardiaceae bacterium]
MNVTEIFTLGYGGHGDDYGYRHKGKRHHGRRHHRHHHRDRHWKGWYRRYRHDHWC